MKRFAMLSVLLLGVTAQAAGFDWSTGPTIPFLRYDLGAPSQPIQVAAGAGIQVSVTHDSLKASLGGKYWDLLDLNLSAFGTLVKPGAGPSFGSLSGAISLCTLSSLLCVGWGHDVIGPDQAFVGRSPGFIVLALSLNVALAPFSPAFSGGSWALPRGNTLYFAGGP